MTDPNNLTPPPELVQQWYDECPIENRPSLPYITTQAARWGADQELEACCALMDDWGLDAADLRAARRPQPQPSLKEQAIDALLSAGTQPASDFKQIDPARQAIILAALELVPEGPAVAPAADESSWRALTMPVCPCCGNKRCPKATNGSLECSGSNKPGQKGSAYAEPAAAPDRPLLELMWGAYIPCNSLDEGMIAALRVVADWIDRKAGYYTGSAAWLRAEADRAEAGES